MLNVVMPNVTMLCVILLTVVMLNVIELRVMAPIEQKIKLNLTLSITKFSIMAECRYAEWLYAECHL
jgi:hypothetical protein